MPHGLRRFQQDGDTHFLTFSCYERRPFLNDDHSKQIFLNVLENFRRRHGFRVFGYVLMPEHVHLLMTEPETGNLATTLNVLKGETSKLLKEDRLHFWKTRYHDFNVFTAHKRVEKLRYIHRNPVVRCLVDSPGDWPWSSYRHYAYKETLPVEIDSEWTRWLKRQKIAGNSSNGWSLDSEILPLRVGAAHP